MKKWKIAFMVGIVFLLGACGGFNPDTALNESREQLEAFFTSYEDDAVVADYTEESVTVFLEDDISAYFTETFKENIPGLIEGIPFEEKTLNPIPNSLDFLSKLEDQVRWVEYEISDYEINTENESVSYFVESKEFGINASSLTITMIQEGDDWKILSIEA